MSAEYRARILVEVALLPDDTRGSKRGSPDMNAALDACNIKAYLEDPEIQNRIDEAGARGIIIGATVQDVREITFAEPIPLDDLLAADLQHRIREHQEAAR